MSLIKNNFTLFIILILIGVIVVQRLFQPKPTDLSNYIKIGGKEYEILKSSVDTLWLPQDTIKIVDYVPSPPIIIVDTIPTEVDTLKILQDYYNKHYYSDVVLLDSIGTAEIKDTISQNRIISRSVIFDYKIPLIKETIVVKDNPTTKLYLGGGLNISSSTRINNVFTGLILQTKRDKMFGLSVGASIIDNKVTPYVGGSLYWKIKVRK